MRGLFIYPLLAVVLFHGVSSAQNILNNGGFEKGLMCYSDYVWAGNYQFQLSADSHSGHYSAKIACVGTGCQKAGIASNLIPAPANQTYKLSMYSKCPAGRVAIVYVPGMAFGDVDAYLACNGDWSLNQLSFSTGTAPTYLFFYIFNMDTSWLEVDDISLTYGDGTAPQHVTLHPGQRNVAISGNNVMVDGKPFLSLGFYDVGYNDLAQAAATGANTVNSYETYNDTDCFNTGQKSYLDTAYELGLNFIPDSSFSARLQTPDVFPGIAQTFAPHLANIAWQLADEPDLIELPPDYVPPSTFLAESAALRTQTSLPVTADFEHAHWDVAGRIIPYNGSTDIWMAEPYGPDFSVINHAVNLFNSIQSKPIWFAQDAIDATLIVPKAYWAILAGSTGIVYYNWDTFKTDAAKLAAATQAFSELKSLQPAIFGTKIDSLVNTPLGLASMSRFDPASGVSYVLAAKSTAGTLRGSFQVAGLAAGQQINVVNENRAITANSGSFMDTFAGISRHVYAIRGNTATLAAAFGAPTGPVANRNWKIQVYNSGIVPANNAVITGLTLNQTSGTVCHPTLASGTIPTPLGSLAPTASATANLLLNFTGCDNTSRFTATLAFGASAGVSVSTIVRANLPM